jgi:hypothetical protein
MLHNYAIFHRDRNKRGTWARSRSLISAVCGTISDFHSK